MVERHLAGLTRQPAALRDASGSFGCALTAGFLGLVRNGQRQKQKIRGDNETHLTFLKHIEDIVLVGSSKSKDAEFRHCKTEEWTKYGTNLAVFIGRIGPKYRILRGSQTGTRSGASVRDKWQFDRIGNLFGRTGDRYWI